MSVSAIGKKLKKARKAADLSKRQLSIKSGVEISTIVKLELGRQQDIHSQRLAKIARVLKVDLNFFQ